MVIEYKDWDNVVKSVEQTIAADTIKMAINKHVLKYATEERDKCPKPKKNGN